MNLAQIIILWIGIAVVAAMLTYVPWEFDRVIMHVEAQQRIIGQEPADYRFVWDAPKPPNAVPSFIERVLSGVQAGLSYEDAEKLAKEPVRPPSGVRLASPHIDLNRLLPPCVAAMLVTAGAMVTAGKMQRGRRRSVSLQNESPEPNRQA